MSTAVRSRSGVSRRQLLRGSAAVLGWAAAWPALARAESQAGRLAFHEVAPGVHIRRGFDEELSASNANAIANIGFITGVRSVAVCDPGGSLIDGRRMRAEIRRTTRLPISHVIMSHAHPDHVFGAAAFLEDRPHYVGHARLPQALAQRGEYYRLALVRLLGEQQTGTIVMPDQVVADTLRVDLGGRHLQLTAHDVAHSDCDLSVYDEMTQTLLPADLLFVTRVPSLDGRLTGWQHELTKLCARKAARAVPGHGPLSVPWPSGADALRRYLDVLLQETRAAIARGEDINTAASTVGRSERNRWRLFEAYQGHNVIQAFKELEWESGRDG